VGLISSLLGGLVRGEAHLVADGMDVVGLPGTALYNAVEGVLDGAENGPELQLGQTNDPTELVHGDPAAISGLAGQLQMLSRALGQTAQGLARLESPTWEGAAAEKYRSVFEKQPQAWEAAQSAGSKVAGALKTWSAAVTAAQDVAAQAIDLWNEGNAFSAEPHDSSSDPGAPLRQQATTMLAEARTLRDQKAAAAALAISGATSTAPAEPSAIDRAVTDVLDSDRSLISDGESLAGGALLAIGGVAKAIRSIDSIESRPDLLPWLQTVTGYDLLQHPKAAVQSVENQVDSAKRNPMQAVGEVAALAVPGADELDVVSDELQVANEANLARIAEWGKAVRGEK
jgi:uncharacterized protein YukE